MSEKDETKPSQEQPYDSSFKALLDDQTLAVLSFLSGEDVEEAQELKEALLKQDTIKPALRVDCAYMTRTRGADKSEVFVTHIEFETAPTLEIEARLLEYFGLLFRKYRKPINQILVCPFETPNVPTPPQLMKRGNKGIMERDYRVVALWKYSARETLEQRLVPVYALLPTMKEAAYEVLAQALQEMRTLYTGQESRLVNHLLWFDAFLGRTTMVSLEDKRRIRKNMSEFRSLLDEGAFVQERVAESLEEGLRQGREEGQAKAREEGREEGLTEGLKTAVLIAIEMRFPTLVEVAQEKVGQVKKSETLRLLMKGIKTASTEDTARFLLDLIAA